MDSVNSRLRPVQSAGCERCEHGKIQMISWTYVVGQPCLTLENWKVNWECRGHLDCWRKSLKEGVRLYYGRDYDESNTLGNNTLSSTLTKDQIEAWKDARGSQLMYCIILQQLWASILSHFSTVTCSGTATNTSVNPMGLGRKKPHSDLTAPVIAQA
jgi:hypothetical protein